MYEYTKYFPETGSKITLQCSEEGMFIMENGSPLLDPRDYYRISGWEEDDGSRCNYPDAILIPSNGTFINENGTFQEKITKYYYDENDNQTGVEELEDVNKSILVLRTDGTSLWQNGEDCEVLKDDFKLMTGWIETSLGIRNAEYNWTNRERRISREKKVMEITITITGETNYFNSNCDSYFAFGESDDSVTAYFSRHFKNRKMIGNISVADMETENYIDLYAVSLIQRRQFQCYGQNYSYSTDIRKINPNYFGTGSTGSFLKKEDCLSDGIYKELSFPRTDFENKSYSLRNKYVEFGKSQLVTMSSNPFAEDGNHNYTCQIKRQIDKKTNKESPALCLDYEADKLIWTCPFYYCLGKKNGEVTAITTRSSTLAKNKEEFDVESQNGFQFTGYWAVDPVDSSQVGYFFHEIMKLDEIPLREYGTTIYPVFTYPICTYLKLNTEKTTDPKGVCKSKSTEDDEIVSAIYDAYGENNCLIRKIESAEKWIETSIPEEITRLKRSTSKYKIMFINCHGGKYKVNDKLDKSYSVLYRDNVYERILDFNHIKYLLQNKRQDEYYFIYVTSCYGGGLVESYVHNDKDNQNYTIVDADESLGENYVFIYQDCANSPAWAKMIGKSGWDELVPDYTKPNLSVGALYDLSSDESYQEQEQYINSNVALTRTKNLQLLVELLENNYEFLKSVLKPEKFLWTDQTYNESISNANNLIISYSRARGNDEKDLFKKYPIIYLLTQIKNYIITVEKDISEQKSMLDFFADENYYSKLALYWYDDNRRLLKNRTMIFNMTRILKNDFDPTLYDASRKEVLEVLKGLIQFIYDLYCTKNAMCDNSKWARTLNKLDNDDWFSYLLGDIPGVVLKGSSEFKQCVFPKFPGFENHKKLESNDVELLRFTGEIENE